MHTLSEIQAWMAELLRRPSALAKDASLTTGASAIVSGNTRLSPVAQLEIYREQFWLRHTAALVEDFPGLGGILGQRDWEKLVEAYLLECPPSSWTLRNLGDRLPSFVKAATWLPHHPLCTDMARLEWQYIELFDAPEAPPLDGAKLAAIAPEAWEAARIVLNPALSLLEVRYPVADLRNALREGKDRGAPILLPEPKEQCLVLYRDADRRLYHRAVSRGAFGLLDALKGGAPLIAACERAAELAPAEAPALEESVGAWFADWGRRGWIVDVTIGRSAR